jgi:hypothetical protein
MIFVLGCASAPQLDPRAIRTWSQSLEGEYPQYKSVIAHYANGPYELFYLAARHTNSMDSDTMRLVQRLFATEHFNVLLIESIPHSSSESPKWFVDEAKKGITETFVSGGESALAVTLAAQKQIPFFAGEPDHQEIYRDLKSQTYTDLDILGFYVVRQIPQWVREQRNRKNLLAREVPPFLKNYCKMFSTQGCPAFETLLTWYRDKMGRELSLDISNEDSAPLAEGLLITQKMSARVGVLRDRFTLGIIQKLLAKYKKIAVVYGASHLITLRRSFDAAFGLPVFTEDVVLGR